jgi:hypothetical protein
LLPSCGKRADVRPDFKWGNKTPVKAMGYR